jgi:hypothetical protein
MSDILEELRYIADSPTREHGGFHEQTVTAARRAIEEITHLRAQLAQARAALEEARPLVKGRLLDWSGPHGELSVLDRIEAVLAT